MRSAIFTKEGEDPSHVANSTLAIYINDEKVGEGKIRAHRNKQQSKLLGYALIFDDCST